MSDSNILGASNIRVQGISFNNNGFSSRILTFPAGTENVGFNNCVFKNTSSAYLVEFLSSSTLVNKNIKFTGNTFESESSTTNVSVLVVYNPLDFVFTNNKISKIGAIKCEYNGSITDSVPHVGNIYIANNTFADIDATNVFVRPNGGTNVTNITVTGNSFYGGAENIVKGAIAVGNLNTGGTGFVENVTFVGRVECYQPLRKIPL